MLPEAAALFSTFHEPSLTEKPRRPVDSDVTILTWHALSLKRLTQIHLLYAITAISSAREKFGV